MVEIKREFFVKGVDNQKRPDIRFHIKRPQNNKIEKWTDDEKAKAMDFLLQCKTDIEIILKQI